MTTRRPACHDKVAYPTAAKARRAIEIIRKVGERREGEGKPTRSYQCPDCHHYHLTSSMD